MVSPVNFGEALRNARERKGYDLAGTARRLRVRPDILHAIETCDFDRMPPRGYARNMVYSYARLVGLNPSEITKMYLDAVYERQVDQARSASSASGFDMGGSARSARRGEGAARGERNRRDQAVGSRRPRGEAPEGYREERPPRRNAFGRAQYDDRRTGPSAGRAYAPDRVHSARGASIPGGQYGNLVAAPKNIAGPSKAPFLIGGAVVVLLLVIVAFFVLGPKGSAGMEDVPDIPITGLTDTSNQAAGGGETPDAKPTVVVPTSVTVTYELPKGVEAYAVIDVDGTSEQLMLTGPVKETVDVTGTWSIATWVPDMKVTVDGEPVEFSGTAVDGMPQASVSFEVWLEAWYEEHPEAREAAEDAEGEGGADATADDTAAAGQQPAE